MDKFFGIACLDQAVTDDTLTPTYVIISAVCGLNVDQLLHI